MLLGTSKVAAVNQLDDQTGASPIRTLPSTGIVIDRAGGLKLAASSKQQAAAKVPQPPKAAETRAPVAASGGSSGAAREARQLTDSLFVTHNALPPASMHTRKPASQPSLHLHQLSLRRLSALPESAPEQTTGRRARQAAKATVAPFECGCIDSHEQKCAVRNAGAGSGQLALGGRSASEPRKNGVDRWRKRTAPLPSSLVQRRRQSSSPRAKQPPKAPRAGRCTARHAH